MKYLKILFKQVFYQLYARIKIHEKYKLAHETDTTNESINLKIKMKTQKRVLTHIHGCLRASAAPIRFAGLTVNILLIRFLASGVTVSHSGEGY